ncbi:MAG: hypothetical protein ACTSQ8_25110 [Candidatus Helarchaeota archaeon]
MSINNYKLASNIQTLKSPKKPPPKNPRPKPKPIHHQGEAHKERGQSSKKN